MTMILHSSIILSFWIQSQLHHCQGINLTTEARLQDSLLKNYNKNIKPMQLPRHAVNVTIGLRIRNLLKVDERRQLITTKVWFRKSWKNELFQWNPLEWDNITTTEFHNEQIWKPDIVLYNEASEQVNSNMKIDRSIIATSNGIHRLFAPVTFSMSCKMKVRYFPFDEQSCYFKFGSWAYSMNELDIYPEEAHWVTYYALDSPEWHIHSPETIRMVTKYDCCPHPYIDVSFRIKLKRKPMYQTLTLIAPCLILLLLTAVIFYLPPASGERVGLSITILLSVSVLLQITSENLPRFSEEIPLIGAFFIMIMATTGLCLISTAFVLLVHFNGDYDAPLPRWMKKLFLGKLAKILGVKVSYKDQNKTHMQNSVATTLSEVSEIHTNIVARNRLHNHRDTRKTNSENGFEEKVMVNNAPLLKKIMSDVAYMSSYLKDLEKKDQLGEEWRMAAKVLDRLIFVLLMIVFAVIFLVTFVPLLSE